MTDHLRRWDDVPVRTVLPGMHGRFIHSATMTFALWEFEAGASLPEHSHPHEQVAHLIEGEFELVIAKAIDPILSNQVHQDCECGPVFAQRSGSKLDSEAALEVFRPTNFFLDCGSRLMRAERRHVFRQPLKPL